MRVLVFIIAAFFITAGVPAPASAQAINPIDGAAVSDPGQRLGAMLFQGPWNRHAHRQHTSHAPARGTPPRNAQCGWYMGKVTGHTRRSLWLAQNWAREFPRTSPRPGAVAVWSRGGNRGHVAKIVSMQDRCRAVVHDNRGTYSRNICTAYAFVQP